VSAKPTDIEGYLAALPEDARETLQTLRRMIQAIAPDAVESISYGMPTFKYQGRPLIYLGAWKSHCAIYGMNVEGHRDELAAYEVEKGTIRFPLGELLPESLLRTLVMERKAAIEARAAGTNRNDKSGRESI
jgi:uncharacterized protein YdhG (YjbR/CyaY superfamily)